MPVKSVLHHVEILGRIADVYDAWSQFELYPHFIDGVREVRWLDPQHLFWTADFNGHLAAGESLITLQIPNQRIAWRVINEEGTSGAVSLEVIADEKTRVTIHLTYSEFARWAVISEAEIRKRVAGGLRRFKRHFESPLTRSHGQSSDASSRFAFSPIQPRNPTAPSDLAHGAESA